MNDGYRVYLTAGTIMSTMICV